MTYVHPSGDQVLEAFSSLGGHSFGHTQELRELVDVPENCKQLTSNGLMVSAAGFEPATHALKEYPAINYRSGKSEYKARDSASVYAG
jgi:hypothetical protein